MKNELRIVARVRDVRAQLASHESLRLRQAQARAQATLDEMSRDKAYYEQQAAQTSVWTSPRTDACGEMSFSADAAHNLLSYVAGARDKVLEIVTAMRRAELARKRAQTAADKAAEKYRGEVLRYEAIETELTRRERIARHKRAERADEIVVEDRVNAITALERRLAEMSEQ